MGIGPDDKLKLGATGDYPDGKINESDEGGIQIAIGRENNRVVVHFGKPTAWIGFDQAKAVEFAVTILKHAGANIQVTLGEQPRGDSQAAEREGDR